MPPTDALLPPPDAIDERMRAGQQRLVWLDAGAEIRCLQGHLRLRAAWLVPDAPPVRHDWDLPAHAAWRSPRGQWMQLACLQDAAVAVRPSAPAPGADRRRVPPPTMKKHPEPRGAGWSWGPAAAWLRRWAERFRRARRAA